MGADFYDKATPTFKKSFDHARATLGTADLFTREPQCAMRSVAADILSPVETGEHLVIEREGDVLVGLRGNARVVRVNNPPADLLAAVDASCGAAHGLVEHVYDLSQIADLSLC
jgi:hypothetical protein